MRELCEIAVVGFCVWMAWAVLAPKPIFKIRIAKGALRVTRGRVTADFEHQVREILDQWQIRRGWLAAVRRERRMMLVFSRSVPAGCRQQLRNLWTNI